MKSWYGIDLDGTLAIYDKWVGPEHIGEPIPRMVARVERLLARGETVKIFTARAASTYSERDIAISAIQDWTAQVFGVRLEVTAEKDFAMKQLWDDRARRVKKNLGIRIR